jgi:hypothetical protein
MRIAVVMYLQFIFRMTVHQVGVQLLMYEFQTVLRKTLNGMRLHVRGG